ncbi:hypothetical protein SAMN05216200_10828 [Oceanicella actignis]|uniref:Uncharacterized protein n=1 Tax=Oceanicella actignis TaxID=1189325 RepID=A0A1M7TMZ5_9RHOB|nr:hypothetical protein SAMN05216200_10828 [Oceanicella actignis]
MTTPNPHRPCARPNRALPAHPTPVGRAAAAQEALA